MLERFEIMKHYPKNKDTISSNNIAGKLQHRLINLSVSVEDKVKTVDLFIEAIKSHQESSDLEFREENARLRVKFNHLASNNSGKLSELLEKYEQSTKRKEKIMCEVETLMEKKRGEDKITQAALMKARQRLQNEIQDASDEWKGCEGEREEIWIAEKVKHVRACTVDALQPEIKRLSSSHEAEIKNLLEESAVRERYMKKEVEMEFQREFNQYLDEAEKRKALLLEGRRKKWRSKIDQLEKSYAKRLEEMKEKSAEETNYPTICNNLLDNNYASQINELNDEIQKRIKEMDRVKNQKLDEIIRQKDDTLENITNDQLRQKEEWRRGKSLELRSNLEEELAIIETGIRNDRDTEINALIHSNYELEEKLEKNLEKRKKKEDASMDKNFAETLKHLKKKNDALNANLEGVSQEVHQLRIEHQNILERLETKEQVISKTKRGILALKQACERLESSEMSINASLYEAIEEQNKQQSYLEKRLNELEVAIHDLDWYEIYVLLFPFLQSAAPFNYFGFLF